LNVYADGLSLVDAIERHEVEILEEVETDALVNLYTLLLDVQRNADDFRKDTMDVLLTDFTTTAQLAGPKEDTNEAGRGSRSYSRQSVSD